MTLFGITSVSNGIEFKLMTADQGEVTKILKSLQNLPTDYSSINTNKNLASKRYF